MTTFITEYMDELVSQAGYDKNIMYKTWEAVVAKKNAPAKKVPSWVDKQECNALMKSGKNKGQKCTKLVISGTSKCKLHNKCNVVTDNKQHTEKVTVQKEEEKVVVAVQKEKVVVKEQVPAQKKFASLHEITLTPDDYKNINHDMVKKYATNDWMRGDVIGIKNTKGYGYRNVGKCMWDGKKVVELALDFDEYGHVPSEFLVGKEFHAMYWANVIEHNEFVYAKFVKKNMTNVVETEIYGTSIITFDYTTNGVAETWHLVGEPIDNCWNYYNGQDIDTPDNVKKQHILVGMNYGYE